jgi:hypothetical protein
VRGRTPERLPVVLSREEIAAILKQPIGREQLQLLAHRDVRTTMTYLARGFGIAFARIHAASSGQILVESPPFVED